eukprot:6457382-Amphidinium_carterae.4
MRQALTQPQETEDSTTGLTTTTIVDVPKTTHGPMQQQTADSMLPFLCSNWATMGCNTAWNCFITVSCILLPYNHRKYVGEKTGYAPAKNPNTENVSREKQHPIWGEFERTTVIVATA